MHFEIFSGENVSPESLVGVGPAVREPVNTGMPKSPVKSDFALQDLAGNGLDEFVEHEIRKETVVLRLRIRDPGRKVRGLDHKITAGLKDAMHFPENAVKIIQMFNNVFGNNFVDGMILNGIGKLVEVKDNIGMIGAVNIHTVSPGGFIVAAA